MVMIRFPFIYTSPFWVEDERISIPGLQHTAYRCIYLDYTRKFPKSTYLSEHIYLAAGRSPDLSQPIQQLFEIRRERGLELHVSSALRMDEAKYTGVEDLPL